MAPRTIPRVAATVSAFLLLGSTPALGVPSDPVYPLPGGPDTGHGGSTCLALSSAEAAMGKTAAQNGTTSDGQTWYFGGGTDPAQVGSGCPFDADAASATTAFDTTRFARLFWGTAEPPQLALDGAVDAPSETLSFAGGLSDLTTGTLVWTGNTLMQWCLPASCPGYTPSTIATKVVVHVRDELGNPALLLDPASVGIDDPQVGGVVEVTDAHPKFSVNIQFLVNDPTGLGFLPAISMYNSYNHPPGGDPQTQMSFAGGFRYESRPPEGYIEGDPPLNHQSATFTAAATDPDGTAGDVLTYAWDLDEDGLYDDGTDQSASATFGPGSHTVAVQVTDPDGAVGTFTDPFTIENQPPSSTFDCVPSAPQPGEQVTCTSTSADPDQAPDDPPLLLHWDYPSGSFDGDPLVVTLPAGDNNITLIVTDRDGASMPSTQTITAADTIAPEASLTLRSARVGALLKKGLKGALTVDEATSTTLQGSVSKKLAHRLKLRNPVARGSVTTTGAGTQAFRLTFTKAARRKLKTVPKVAIKVTAVVMDTAGNTSQATASHTYRQ